MSIDSLTNRKETHRTGIWHRKFVRYPYEALYECRYFVDIVTITTHEFRYMLDIYTQTIHDFRLRDVLGWQQQEKKCLFESYN